MSGTDSTGSPQARREVLCLFCPSVGRPSETFIRRHMCDLWPGRTVVVTEQVLHSEAAWRFDGPILELRTSRVPLWRRALQRGEAVAAWRRVAVTQFLRRNHVTVALVEWLDVGLEWLPLCRENGIRVVAHSFGYDACQSMLSPAREWRTRYREYAQTDAVISVSQAMNRGLHEIGLPLELLKVVPCGTDVPSEFPRQTCDGDRVRCLAVGRMVPKKAPILMLDAFRRAAEKNPKLELRVIGDGPIHSAACDYVEAMRLTERVKLLGTLPHDQLRHEMNSTDIFLQHSVVSRVDGDEEGLPVSILEAMANGVPVVSTRHGGIPDAVVDGETGFLVKEGDVEGMANRLVELAASRVLREQFGRAGWQRARDLFTWERSCATLQGVLGLT